jgi:hypothetical protein
MRSTGTIGDQLPRVVAVKAPDHRNQFRHHVTPERVTREHVTGDHCAQAGWRAQQSLNSGL